MQAGPDTRGSTGNQYVLEKINQLEKLGEVSNHFKKGMIG